MGEQKMDEQKMGEHRGSPLPNVVMMSFWRNDEGRRLQERAEHLLSKTYRNLRYMWMVGDCQDETYSLLEGIARSSPRHITLSYFETGIMGMDIQSRAKRLKGSLAQGLRQVRASDDVFMIHESDLVSAPDVVEQLLGTRAGPLDAAAGWPVLPVRGKVELFYDIWAYRANGNNFISEWPYHAVYRRDRPFEVDSVGSVWLCAAADVRTMYANEDLCVGLCRQLKEKGRRIWVNPSVRIVQPKDLWNWTEMWQ